MRKITTGAAMLCLLTSMTSWSQAKIAYASDADLAQAARCSVLNYANELRTSGFSIKEVSGTAVFKKVWQKGQKISGSVSLPFSVIELTPNASTGSNESQTISETVNLSLGKDFPPLTAACKTLTVHTLDRHGRNGPTQSGLLFDTKNLKPSFEPKNKLLSDLTLGQTFSGSTQAGGGLKLNFLGMIKIGYDNTLLDQSKNSGFTVTYCFNVPPTNGAGVPYGSVKCKPPGATPSTSASAPQ